MKTLLPSLDQYETPRLLLEKSCLISNVRRLQKRLSEMGKEVSFRPHMKTAKCIDVAEAVFGEARPPITVSTLKEAEYFFDHGFNDIIYAVGIAPKKLSRVIELRRRGAELKVLVDNIDSAMTVSQAAAEMAVSVPALIEVDTDGHRAGVAPSDGESLRGIAAILDARGSLAGVLTHAGHSYNCTDMECAAAIANDERDGAALAAATLRQSGYAVPIVSVGSTPTAHAARSYDGITEVRAGVFMFFDLVMAGIGACAIEDIGLSVLATVIGHQKSRGWIIVDAGWMAMSRDRGTQKQRIDQVYGLVCGVDGAMYPDLLMVEANQEHGILALRANSTASLPDLPIGSLVRILPNHACATAAQHEDYLVLEQGTPSAVWKRFSGW